MNLDRKKLNEIIFSSDTPAGKLYDIILLGIVTLSVIIVMLDSISSVRETYSLQLSSLEWLFTITFTIDYTLRIYCAKKKTGYALSFFGIVDLLSVAPTYLSLFIPGSQYLATLRFLRILRVFRVLKLSSYQGELNMLLAAVKASWRRITVFLFIIMTIVVVLGSFMYTIESKTEGSGFTSIPRSIYWAIVTLTTVGYGDISPQTGIGQAIAALIMILGYSIIVVLTGIVLTSVQPKRDDSGNLIKCSNCGVHGHEIDAFHCKHCGSKL